MSKAPGTSSDAACQMTRGCIAQCTVLSRCVVVLLVLVNPELVVVLLAGGESGNCLDIP